MAYYIDLFSPETYLAFAASKRDISGFRERHKNMAAKSGRATVSFATLRGFRGGSDCSTSSAVHSSVTSRSSYRKTIRLSSALR